MRELLLANGITGVVWNAHLWADDGKTWVAYVDGWIRGRYLECQSRRYHLYLEGKWEEDLARMTRLGSYDALPILATKAAVTRTPETILAAVRRALEDPEPRSRLVVGPPPEWWGERAA